MFKFLALIFKVNKAHRYAVRGYAMYKANEFAAAAEQFHLAWQIWGVELKDRSELRHQRATLLMNWANMHGSQGYYQEAVDKYQAAWQIWGVELRHRRLLHYYRATLLMSWASTLHSRGHYKEAVDKYQAAWQIWGIELKGRRALHNHRAGLLMNWALTLDAQGQYEDAAAKYQAAWQIRGIELKHRPELHANRAGLLMNWANTLRAQGHYAEAARKYQAAWQIWVIDLNERPDLHADRAGLLMNWAVTLSSQGHYVEAADKYAAAWQIAGVELKELPELHANRATLLVNWASMLDSQGAYAEATEKYAAAWRIRGIDLKDRPELHADRAGLLMNWASTLHAQCDYVEATRKCADAWQMLSIDLKDRSELDANRARLLMNWASTLAEQGRYQEAAARYQDAWQIWGVDLKVRPELLWDCAMLLMNWANVLRAQDHSAKAVEKYAAAWQIWGTDLRERPELHARRAMLLMNWALTLNSQGCYSEASGKYADAWQIYGVDLKDRPELHANRVRLLLNWASTLIVRDHAEEAADTYAGAWQISTTHLRDRQDCDVLVSMLAQNWQTCWKVLPDPQEWARGVSTELCRRLGDQNWANPPHWLDELHHRFAQFHLKWMQDSLSDGEPEHLVAILSRVSSWRMATALLDELETQAVSTASSQANENKDTQTLQQYQRLRLEVRRRIQQLQEKEHAAGRLGTDPTGVRGISLSEDRPQRSPEDQARLDAEINALRAEYDAVYRGMQQAQAQAAQVPGYAALSVDRSLLTSQQLLAQLANPSRAQQALLIVFDQKAEGDTPLASSQHLSGALLLKDGQVHWHAMDEMAQGTAYLAQYEHWMRPQNTKGMAFRRGDTDKSSTVSTDSPSIEREPLIDQGIAITPETLWPSLGEWVKRTLWQPLAQQGLLNGVEEIVLVTQGQDAHSIPWQMGAPVAATAIKRYPGLMFYAMDTELLSRAACHEDAAFGVAHYKGQVRALPFARIEAQTLSEIWAHTGSPVHQDFDYLHPKQRVGSVHIAGHGSHALEASQAAVAAACLAVGENTRWGLSELMNSPARPKQVYLSCCVAGRTTDLAGEQYGVTAALLQHGTREVVASSVSLEDIWGSSLSIVTHSLMSQHGLELKHALAQAQAMVTGQLPWDESARAWVLKGWRQRLIELIAQMLGKRQTETTGMDSAKVLAGKIESRMPTEVFQQLSHLAVQELDHAAHEAWCQALAQAFFDDGAGRTSSQDRREMLAAEYAELLLEHAHWRMQPTALIAGSLAYATTAVGG